jgi:hypothetical protein
VTSQRYVLLTAFLASNRVANVAEGWGVAGGGPPRTRFGGPVHGSAGSKRVSRGGGTAANASPDPRGHM